MPRRPAPETSQYPNGEWRGCPVPGALSQKVGRTADAAIAGQIVSNLNVGRTFAYAADQEKAILALTPAKVAEAFRKHIDPNKLVIIRAGDFQK